MGMAGILLPFQKGARLRKEAILEACKLCIQGRMCEFQSTLSGFILVRRATGGRTVKWAFDPTTGLDYDVEIAR